MHLPSIQIIDGCIQKINSTASRMLYLCVSCLRTCQTLAPCFLTEYRCREPKPKALSFLPLEEPARPTAKTLYLKSFPFLFKENLCVPLCRQCILISLVQDKIVALQLLKSTQCPSAWVCCVDEFNNPGKRVIIQQHASAEIIKCPSRNIHKHTQKCLTNTFRRNLTSKQGGEISKQADFAAIDRKPNTNKIVRDGGENAHRQAQSKRARTHKTLYRKSSKTMKWVAKNKEMGR